MIITEITLYTTAEELREIAAKLEIKMKNVKIGEDLPKVYLTSNGKDTRYFIGHIQND